jgi:hypothetical protein
VCAPFLDFQRQFGLHDGPTVRVGVHDRTHVSVARPANPEYAPRAKPPVDHNVTHS